jgi:hypothetical protein
VTLRIAQAIAWALEGYALAGLVFAASFLPRGIGQVDPRMHASPVAVRLIVLPGVVAFWPLFLRRWLKGTPVPVERNAHRQAARPTGEPRA